MTTINASLTTDQFIKAFGDNEYVRDFSAEGIEWVLGYVSDSQDSKVCVAKWEDFFIDASEVTSEKLISNNQGFLDNHPKQILELVRDMDGAGDELIAKIDDNEELSPSELLASLKSEIEACDGWVRAAANFIADDKGWYKLNNGGWVGIA